MIIAEGILESGTFWSVAIGLLGTLVGAVLGAYLPGKFARSKKKEIEFRWVRTTPLLKPSASLRVTHESTVLEKPRLVDVSIRNGMDEPVTRESFHDGQSITIELDAKIIDILERETKPDTSVMPTVSIADQQRIEIAPCLLAPGQVVEIAVLVDGRGQAGKFKFQSPLIGIEPKKMPSVGEAMKNLLEVMHRSRIRSLRRVLWASAAGMVLGVIAIFTLLAAHSAEEKYDRLKHCVVANQNNVKECQKL
ncbi:hypothetical protein ACGFZQ_07115 [Streptomyces sp. NPDC048254]|uniref:hypothetical protein n=1 Tax=Streptomyces sp. NPDC048254 TaxID=3365525 RepID=UPI0037135891